MGLARYAPAMNTLAIDTCFGACSVAAIWPSEDGFRVASRFELLARGHAERLVPMMAEVMGEAPFDFAHIERIIVTDGPGTFTGQRVGIAAARALALATGATLASLSSLSIMAYTASHTLGDAAVGRDIAVAVDARRGEVYFQCFSADGRRALAEPALLPYDMAAGQLVARKAILVGSGAALVAAGMNGTVDVRLPSLEPDVRYIPSDVHLQTGATVRPLYLRPPDAKPQDGAALERIT